MDMIIRNIDPTAVKKIDELAKEKGISRQEFLKGQLEMLAFFREQTTRERHLENLLDKNSEIIKKVLLFYGEKSRVLGKVTS
ncbi:hypothetical protein KXS12_26385 [Priestia filamentosa]|uniref:hypothetical protein n=1 Tax=Priestia filamentosa TaxID=1402861 RepID=UPI003F182726